MTLPKMKRVDALRTCGNHPEEGWLHGTEGHTLASPDVYTATTGTSGGMTLILLAPGGCASGRRVMMIIASCDDDYCWRLAADDDAATCTPYSKRRIGFFGEFSCTFSAVFFFENGSRCVLLAHVASLVGQNHKTQDTRHSNHSNSNYETIHEVSRAVCTAV